MTTTLKTAFCSKCGKDLKAKVPVDARGIICFTCDNTPTGRIPSILFSAMSRSPRRPSIPPRPGATQRNFTMMPDPNSPGVDPGDTAPTQPPKPTEEQVHRDGPILPRDSGDETDDVGEAEYEDEDFEVEDEDDEESTNEDAE